MGSREHGLGPSSAFPDSLAGNWMEREAFGTLTGFHMGCHMTVPAAGNFLFVLSIHGKWT